MPKILNTKVEITGTHIIDVPVYFGDTDDGEIISELFEDFITDDNDIVNILMQYNDNSQVSNYSKYGECEYTCDVCNTHLTEEEWVTQQGLCKECYKNKDN